MYIYIYTANVSFQLPEHLREVIKNIFLNCRKHYTHQNFIKYYQTIYCYYLILYIKKGEMDK